MFFVLGVRMDGEREMNSSWKLCGSKRCQISACDEKGNNVRFTEAMMIRREETPQSTMTQPHVE